MRRLGFHLTNASTANLLSSSPSWLVVVAFCRGHRIASGLIVEIVRRWSNRAAMAGEARTGRC